MEKLTLYNVAKMYYIDNMGQQEIANQLGISRPQVSRILKEARETKIVDITLHMPCNVSAGSLALRLESQLKPVSYTHLRYTCFSNTVQYSAKPPS